MSIGNCKSLSIICCLFVQVFKEQSVDGSILLLLREEHLLGNPMKMKLGAVLKLKAALASKVDSCPICLHCIHCHTAPSRLYDIGNNDSESPDETASNASENRSNHIEGRVPKTKDLVSSKQNTLKAFSTSEAIKSNESHKIETESGEHVKERNNENK